jgi:hypothetical protein
MYTVYGAGHSDLGISASPIADDALVAASLDAPRVGGLGDDPRLHEIARVDPRASDLRLDLLVADRRALLLDVEQVADQILESSK